jgi:hypothetical protein
MLEESIMAIDTVDTDDAVYGKDQTSDIEYISNLNHVHRTPLALWIKF